MRTKLSLREHYRSIQVAVKGNSNSELVGALSRAHDEYGLAVACKFSVLAHRELAVGTLEKYKPTLLDRLSLHKQLKAHRAYYKKSNDPDSIIRNRLLSVC
ncbi:hypothetical protein [Aliivibrio fischeri]|uniref:Uncharacterized protein n=1 Tax=Aliivibrio fischeri TaxID=668 RepID=A0A510UF08_ALIFS|nr:hypothetical protein [Aliivibrio fischeri]GEK13202.1 hypothetical protein AFI02nite_12380 [Aliivibrio fischeri]